VINEMSPQSKQDADSIIKSEALKAALAATAADA
jgi:hypothetical protein